jgi:hypothetical protein
MKLPRLLSLSDFSMPSVPIRSVAIKSTAAMVILAEDRNRHGADLPPARTQLIISSTSRASVPPRLRRLHTTLVSLGSKTLSLASHAKLSSRGWVNVTDRI